MPDANRYRARNPATSWGCGVAVVLFVPAFVALIFIDALGHCAPGEPCIKGFWLAVVAPSAAVALLGFIITRLMVGLLRRRDRG